MSAEEQRERSAITRDLESADDEVRRLAVERMGLLAVHEVVPCLVGCLGDPSWRVRKAAVERLAAWPDADEVATALCHALADGDNPGRRNAAVDALVRRGAAALPRLMETSRDGDPDVRKFAVDALAGIGDARATEALIACLRDDDTNVRASAADALGAIGGEAASEALCDVARAADQEALVRFSALHALAALDAPIRARDLRAALGDAMLRPVALEVLGRVADDEEAVQELLKGLEGPSRALREAATRSLLRLLGRRDGAGAAELLRLLRERVQAQPAIADAAVERLLEADLTTRLALVQFLGAVQHSAAAVAVLLAARDEALEQVALGALEAMGAQAEAAIDEVWADLEADVRRSACSFFGRAGGARSGERLCEALEDGDPSVRVAAAHALAARPLPGAVAMLARRLELSAADALRELSEDELAAMTAALVSIARAGGADRVIDALRAALAGAAEPVREAVATVLGSIGRAQDADLMELLLKDASGPVRRAAVEALARLEPGSARESLRMAIGDESAEVRAAAARALGRGVGSESLSDLERLAADEDVHVRATAVGALLGGAGAQSDPRWRASALSYFDAACSDAPAVALAAIEAVARVGGPPALRATRLLERPEPELLREVIRCLGRHADPVALEALIPLVGHADWSVRAEAVEVMAERSLRRAAPAILRRLEVEQDEFVRSVSLRALARLEG
ncbi:MAG TPA: HEAT repeat domain-containing protein [Myxococcota bacterium]|nr:HEAT repeat domain-containing protein [Myxococcota bacterium]